MTAGMNCQSCGQKLDAMSAKSGYCGSCGKDVDANVKVPFQKQGHRGQKMKKGKAFGRSHTRKKKNSQYKTKKPGAVISVHADGSCRHTGDGGWAFAYFDRNGSLVTASGSESGTTNNRMELMGVLRALQNFKPCMLNITSDSQYVIKGCQTWMRKWKQKGWRLGSGGHVKNADLWKKIDAEISRHHSVNFVWVRGHSGNYMNELCDTLASNESMNLKEDNELKNE